MGSVGLLLVVLIAGVCLLALLHGKKVEIKATRFYRKSINEMSMSHTVCLLESVATTSACAVRCSQNPSCTAFVYSTSKRVCQLGQGVASEMDKKHLPDERLFQMKPDELPDIMCASLDYSRTRCYPGTTEPVSILLREQLSTRPCVPEYTYGLGQDNNVWVTGGCRGLFAISLR